MTFLERLLVITVWLIFLYLILRLIVNKAKRFNVRKPHLIFWDKSVIVIPIGFFFLLLSMFLLALISPSSVTNIEASIFFVFPLMLNLYLLLRSINWKVEFGADDFEYTNIFGKKFKFTYSQIKSVTIDQFGEVIKVENKRIIVDILTEGKSEFLNAVDESRIKRKFKPRHR